MKGARRGGNTANGYHEGALPLHTRFYASTSSQPHDQGFEKSTPASFHVQVQTTVRDGASASSKTGLGGTRFGLGAAKPLYAPIMAMTDTSIPMDRRTSE